MAYLLNLVYLSLLAVLSPWLLLQAVAKGKYRQGLFSKLLGWVPRRRSDEYCVWLHAVSVGEVNLLESLIEEISRQRPHWQCVVSTTTRTGYEVAKKKYPDLHVFYCPLDFTWSTAAAMRRIKPDVLLLAELELWPNLIRAAKRRGVHVGVVNGRLSAGSFRGYRRLGALIRPTLDRLDLLAVQNEEYAERFEKLGAREDAIHVTGSVKFDGAQTNRHNPATQWLTQLAGFSEEDIVFLAGSTQEGEEKLALEAFRRLHEDHPRLRLVLVPRHPERFDRVARLLEKSRLPWRRRSELSQSSPKKRRKGKKQNARPEEAAVSQPAPRILLVDTVGELGAWWGTATIAFVGGSLGSRGGQNMLEPAAYGAAVSFGPNTKNFRDIVSALLKREAAVVVSNRKQLIAFVGRCLHERVFAARLGQRARSLVLDQQGAAEDTIHHVIRLAEASESSRRAA